MEKRLGSYLANLPGSGFPHQRHSALPLSFFASGGLQMLGGVAGERVLFGSPLFPATDLVVSRTPRCCIDSSRRLFRTSSRAPEGLGFPAAAERPSSPSLWSEPWASASLLRPTTPALSMAVVSEALVPADSGFSGLWQQRCSCSRGEFVVLGGSTRRQREV